MERTISPIKLVLPDAVNCSSQTNFTQIPNSLLRNPNISAKAKTIITILLSNKDGWHSCISFLLKMMKEGKDAIQSGLQELEENKYLLRIRYRSKLTKAWQGSFWAYTDTPGSFEIETHIALLNEKGLEIEYTKKPEPGNPDMALPELATPPIIILIDNNNKEKNIVSSEHEDSLGYITPSLFELFWKSYPRKVGKGKALTAWNKLCNDRKKRPLWLDIRKAIRGQIKSSQWQYSIDQIPHAATWLNGSRWLDDPNQMKPYIEKENKKWVCPIKGRVFGKSFGNNEGCIKCEEDNNLLYMKCKFASQN
jgi:hypothetical protein